MNISIFPEEAQKGEMKRKSVTKGVQRSTRERKGAHQITRDRMETHDKNCTEI